MCDITTEMYGMLLHLLKATGFYQQNHYLYTDSVQTLQVHTSALFKLHTLKMLPNCAICISLKECAW